MSAQRDRKQKISFYYGKAITDLAAYMPEGDELPAPTTTASLESLSQNDQLHSIHRVLDQAFAHMGQIEERRTMLSFLLRDLRRIL